MREHNGRTFVEGTFHNMEELLEIIRVLRSPQGCSWDRAQNHETLKKCLTDETEDNDDDCGRTNRKRNIQGGGGGG